MRKQLKKKKAACALCKPHKRGWENRWTARERGLEKAASREMRQARLRMPR